MGTLKQTLGLDRWSWVAEKRIAIEEVPQVIEKLAEVAELLTDARADLAMAEIDLQHWQGIWMTNLAANQPRVSEWKVRRETEANPKWKEKKLVVVDAQERIHLLEGLQAALQAKVKLVEAVVLGLT